MLEKLTLLQMVQANAQSTTSTDGTCGCGTQQTPCVCQCGADCQCGENCKCGENCSCKKS